MDRKQVTLAISIIVLVFLLWLFATQGAKLIFGCRINTDQFRNVYTSLSALFSALAFGAVILTLLLQRGDLKVQKERANLQNFENNFFKLLEQHHRIVDSFIINVKENDPNDSILPMPEKKSTFLKLEAFDFLARDFKHRFIEVKKIRFHVDKSYQTIFIHAFLHHTYGKYGYMLSHYFRNLYHIVVFIDESKALKTLSEKKKYVSLLRAQLSAPEINLLAWNCMTYHGKAFKPLVERYKLLKNMNFTYEMVDLKWLAEIYPHIKKEIRKDNPIFSFETEKGLEPGY